MKRMMLILLLMVSIPAARLMAGTNDEITTMARRTFEKEFTEAQSVKWDKLKDVNMYTVRFIYREQALVAWIDEDGALAATVRSWNRENLPFMVSATIARRYKDFTVTKVEELATPIDVSYLFYVENEKSRIVVRIYGNGGYYEINKEKRKAAAPVHRG